MCRSLDLIEQKIDPLYNLKNKFFFLERDLLLLKVIKFQKQILKFSFAPKTKKMVLYFCPSL